MLKRIRAWVYPPVQDEPWPTFIFGRQLSILANKLHHDGYTKIDLSYWMIQSMRGSYYTKYEILIPNKLTCIRIHWPTVREYALMTTNAPPIILNEFGGVMDGTQRLLAARERGDKSIWAYLPNGLKPTSVMILA